MTSMQFTAIPEYVSKYVTDSLKGVYLEAVKEFGTTDVVLQQDPTNGDVVYAGSRDQFLDLLVLNDDEPDRGYVRFCKDIAQRIQKSASEAIGVPQAFWFIVLERATETAHVCGIGLTKARG